MSIAIPGNVTQREESGCQSSPDSAAASTSRGHGRPQKVVNSRRVVAGSRNRILDDDFRCRALYKAVEIPVPVRYKFVMPRLSPALDEVVASVGTVARGTHQSQLDPKTLAMLRQFGAFLLKEGKSESTVRVYKSLCAKAAAEGVVDSTNPMMVSAARALARFAASK